MLTKPFILLSIISIQAYANTETNENNKLNQTGVIEEKANLDSKLDPLVDTIKNEKDNLDQTRRQKRFGLFDYEDFPFNLRSLSYPSYVRKDDSGDSDALGEINKLHVIRKRLQDLVTVNKRQYLPPRPAIQPTFVPIFYISSVRCLCDPVTQTPPLATSNKPQQIPPNPATSNEEISPTTIPDLPSRIFGNDESDDDNDGVRPISFNPIPSKKPLSRPSPPVEHGTVQEGAEPPQTDTLASNQIPNTPGTVQFDVPAADLTPSTCDKAVLKCCHQKRTNYECFKIENCPEPPFKKSLCESDVLSNVVNKFIEYFKRTRGV